MGWLGPISGLSGLGWVYVCVNAKLDLEYLIEMDLKLYLSASLGLIIVLISWI